MGSCHFGRRLLTFDLHDDVRPPLTPPTSGCKRVATRRPTHPLILGCFEGGSCVLNVGKANLNLDIHESRNV